MSATEQRRSGNEVTGHEKVQTETSQALDNSPLDLGDPEVGAALGRVRDAGLKWVVLGYVPRTNKIKVDDEGTDALGTGDAEDVAELFSQGRPQFMFCSVRVHAGDKLVLVSSFPDGLPVVKRTMCGAHTNALEALAKPHCTLYARNESDLDLDSIVQKAERSAGAKY
eukprot:TRINITY_DN667_c0_g2_i1.p1 TRINITY_DN667_c0_g2~~TRINITY_DN667_c0_g2_i1.p1  ORF type:complete len:168 (-),score=69.64 TRINITY_DN667_c0_g2_i1:74-577(-)